MHQKKKLAIVFYSTRGHVWQLALKMAEGARSHPDVEVDIFRCKETLSDTELARIGGLELRKQWENIEEANPDELPQYHGIAFGIPTKMGIPVSQMKRLWESCEWLGQNHQFVGKYATVFGTSLSQHGGTETSLLTAMIPLLHLGMIIVGLPCSWAGLKNDVEVSGGSPLGITTISGRGRQPSENELKGAYYQGKHFANMVTGNKH